MEAYQPSNPAIQQKTQQNDNNRGIHDSGIMNANNTNANEALNDAAEALQPANDNPINALANKFRTDGIKAFKENADHQAISDLKDAIKLHQLQIAKSECVVGMLLVKQARESEHSYAKQKLLAEGIAFLQSAHDKNYYRASKELCDMITRGEFVEDDFEKQLSYMNKSSNPPQNLCEYLLETELRNG